MPISWLFVVLLINQPAPAPFCRTLARPDFKGPMPEGSRYMPHMPGGGGANAPFPQALAQAGLGADPRSAATPFSQRSAINFGANMQVPDSAGVGPWADPSFDPTGSSSGSKSGSGSPSSNPAEGKPPHFDGLSGPYYSPLPMYPPARPMGMMPPVPTPLPGY